MKKRGKRWLRIFFFPGGGWGVVQDRKCTTKQNNNKTQMQHRFFPTLWFPQQTHAPSIRNATGSEWGIHEEESLTPYIKHDGVLMFLSFSTVKDTQNKQLESKLGGKEIALIRKHTIRDRLQMGMWKEESPRDGGFLQWTHSRQRLDSEFKRIWVAQHWCLFLSSIS